ncbi:hypothetical protein VYU27_000353 [Nannochloropsis oceanica]
MTKRVRGASSSSSQSVLVTIFLAAACAIFMKAATCLAWRCYGAAAGRRASVSEVPLLSRRLPSSASLVRVRSLGHQTLMASDAADGGRASAAVKQDSNKRADKKGTSQPQKAKLDLQPPRGTRDFYPEEMRLRNWLFGHWRQVAREHGFEEYDAPVLESEALYVRKAGEEVTEQLYNFEDKGGRRVALRPEMTPSLARMVMAKRNGLVLPVKWFSFPQCWRYERMTRGRRREHYQWNMDVWGISGVEAEAELLAAIVSFFARVGLTANDVGIKVNSRGVLTEVLAALGVPEENFAATCVLVDKLEKIPLSAIQDDLTALGLEESVVLRLLEVIQSKDVEGLEKAIGKDSAALGQLRQLFEYARAYGFDDWLVLDASVVRGLAYYTGVVFEAFDRQGELRAICGGGRYDKLLEAFGGEALPAVGFGFGDAVIIELLESKKLVPALPLRLDASVFAMETGLQTTAIAAATSLRSAGLMVDLQLEARKTKWAFKHADRLGATYVVLVGAGEAAEGKVKVKHMATGQQETLPVVDLGNWMLAASAASAGVMHP